MAGPHSCIGFATQAGTTTESLRCLTATSDAVPARHEGSATDRIAIGPFVYVRFHGVEQCGGAHAATTSLTRGATGSRHGPRAASTCTRISTTTSEAMPRATLFDCASATTAACGVDSHSL